MKRIVLISFLIVRSACAMAPNNNQGAQAINKAQDGEVKENEAQREERIKEQRDKFLHRFLLQL